METYTEIGERMSNNIGSETQRQMEILSTVEVMFRKRQNTQRTYEAYKSRWESKPPETDEAKLAYIVPQHSVMDTLDKTLSNIPEEYSLPKQIRVQRDPMTVMGEARWRIYFTH